MVSNFAKLLNHILLSRNRHLMTGIGSYFYLVWAIWLRHCLNERQDEYVLSWPSKFFSLPEVVPRSNAAKANGNSKTRNGHTNGHTNGHAKLEDRKSV